MAHQTITAHLHMKQEYAKDADGSLIFPLRKEWSPVLHAYDFASEENRVYVGPQQVTVEVPDDFNPIPQQVAALEKEKADALAKYHASVSIINERLSKLLAIEHTA